MKDKLTPSRILDVLVKNTPKHYTCIIIGKTGPTGKTWLKNRLTEHGFVAYDLSESVNGFVMYEDVTNHYRVEHYNERVIIILNEKLSFKEIEK